MGLWIWSHWLDEIQVDAAKRKDLAVYEIFNDFTAIKATVVPDLDGNYRMSYVISLNNINIL